MPSTAVQWKVGGDRQLIWRGWDDEHVVFDPLSGDTHVLNSIAAVALKFLQSRSLDCQTLSQCVARELELELDDDLSQHLQRLLAKFEDLGLIEPRFI